MGFRRKKEGTMSENKISEPLRKNQYVIFSKSNMGRKGVNFLISSL